jgi:hypothetical protein
MMEESPALPAGDLQKLCPGNGCRFGGKYENLERLTKISFTFSKSRYMEKSSPLLV